MYGSGQPYKYTGKRAIPPKCRLRSAPRCACSFCQWGTPVCAYVRVCVCQGASGGSKKLRFALTKLLLCGTPSACFFEKWRKCAAQPQPHIPSQIMRANKWQELFTVCACVHLILCACMCVCVCVCVCVCARAWCMTASNRPQLKSLSLTLTLIQPFVHIKSNHSRCCAWI